CHFFGGQPQPSDGAEALARGGGVIGWIVGQPFVNIDAVWFGTIVVGAVLVLSVFIITKTPPNRIGARLRELYAYLFGAQLATEEERAAAKAAKSEEPLEFGSLSDIGFDVEDTGSL